MRNENEIVCEITNQLRYCIRPFTPDMYSCGLSHVVEELCCEGNRFILYLTVMEHKVEKYARAHIETKLVEA